MTRIGPSVACLRRSTYTYYWLPRGHSTHRDVDILNPTPWQLYYRKQKPSSLDSEWPRGRTRPADQPADTGQLGSQHTCPTHTRSILSSSSFHPSASVVFTSTTTGQPDFRPIVSSCSGWRKVATFSHVTTVNTLYIRSVLAGVTPVFCFGRHWRSILSRISPSFDHDIGLHENIGVSSGASPMGVKKFPQPF